MSYSSSGYTTNTSSTTGTSSTSTTSTTVTSTDSTVSTVTPAVNTVSTVTQTSTVTDESLLPTDASIGDRVVLNSVTWEFGSTGWTVVSEGPTFRFPSNPMLEQRYSVSNKTWEFDGEKWVLVYVGTVEDQDDYVKKEAVEHFEYFGVVNGENLPAHDLYGEEVDNILAMLNNGPSVYSTIGSPLVVKTGRQNVTGDSSGVQGTNFQTVGLKIDLRTITSIASITLDKVTINGKLSPLILEPTTYSALLDGRPDSTSITYSWSISKPSANGNVVAAPPSEAKLLPPYNKAFVQALFTEEGEYNINVTAQISGVDSIGNAVALATESSTLAVLAAERLIDDNDSPPARVVTNFLNPERAETSGGYLFLKTEAAFLQEDGTTPNIPIMDFGTKLSNGLHLVFNMLGDGTQNAFFMVHEDLMNDRLRVESDQNTDFNIESFDTFLIGRPQSADDTINYGTMRGSSYETLTDAYPKYWGTSAYNYRGLSILDPFRESNISSELDQGANVSVNSYLSGSTQEAIQYVDETTDSLAITTDASNAQVAEHEVTMNSFGQNSFANGSIVGRFTRGYLQSVTEVIENVSITSLHFFRDPSSKYFITNTNLTTPTDFNKIFIYDLWIVDEMKLSLAASEKFGVNDIVDGAFPNYEPTST